MKKPDNANMQRLISCNHYHHNIKTFALSVSDTSDELRRNLIETVNNIEENNHLYEELNKFKKDFERKEQDNYNNVNTDNNTSEDELRKLRKDLINSNTIAHNGNVNIRKYIQYPIPVKKSQIKCFVMNFMNYINYLMSLPIKIKGINYMKVKLETRYNDFRNKGLNKEHFQTMQLQM